MIMHAPVHSSAHGGGHAWNPSIVGRMQANADKMKKKPHKVTRFGASHRGSFSVI